MDRNKYINLFLYFIIAVVFIGSIGVWLPLIIDHASNNPTDKLSLYQNLSTYYMAIFVAGCIDLILLSIQKIQEATNPVGAILFLILLLFISVGSIVLISFLIHDGNEEWAKRVSVVGVIAAYVMWFWSNIDSSVNSLSPLGGEIK